MAATTLSITLASILAVICVGSIILNLVVIGTIIIGGFAGRKKGHIIYVLALTTICGDVFQVALHLGYLVPSAIKQEFLVDLPTVKFLSFLFQTQWYQAMVTQILTSASRFVTLVLPRYRYLFSRKLTIAYCISLIPFAVILGVVANYVMPCCTPYFYYATYSYAYLDQTEANFNYSEKYLDLPLNAFTSLFSIASYSTIFLEIHRNNRNVAQNLGNGTGNQQIRSRKEIAYTFQFALLSLFTLFAWVTFHFFPFVVPDGHFEVFAFTGYFHMTHCTATAITLLFMNREIGSFAKMMLKNGPLAKITSIANVSTIYRHSSDPTGQI